MTYYAIRDAFLRFVGIGIRGKIQIMVVSGPLKFADRESAERFRIMLGSVDDINSTTLRVVEITEPAAAKLAI